MTIPEILEQLNEWGEASYKRILMNHGAVEPVLGVKISELKKIQKQVKQDYQLALELFETGIYDAQYLAGLIADDARMTKKDLNHWLAKSNSPAISSSVVSWVAAESPHGMELALKWITSKKEMNAQAGWTTLSCLVALKKDDELDLEKIKALLQQVEQTIHQQHGLVRYSMNTFVISVGCYISSLTADAMKTAKKIGTVTADMGNTACKVPEAVEYIEKVKKRGAIGKKRKTVKC
ncbi:MAG: DNA alkylation repair protein [Planctomycetaceae bacterium]|nr:DNA alkylation repair protein [Planctomycetaceae bacterium]